VAAQRLARLDDQGRRSEPCDLEGFASGVCGDSRRGRGPLALIPAAACAASTATTREATSGESIACEPAAAVAVLGLLASPAAAADAAFADDGPLPLPPGLVDTTQVSAGGGSGTAQLRSALRLPAALAGLRDRRSAVSSDPSSGLPDSRAAAAASRCPADERSDGRRTSGDLMAGDAAAGDCCRGGNACCDLGCCRLKAPAGEVGPLLPCCAIC